MSFLDLLDFRPPPEGPGPAPNPLVDLAVSLRPVAPIAAPSYVLGTAEFWLETLNRSGALPILQQKGVSDGEIQRSVQAFQQAAVEGAARGEPIIVRPAQGAPLDYQTGNALYRLLQLRNIYFGFDAGPIVDIPTEETGLTRALFHPDETPVLFALENQQGLPLEVAYALLRATGAIPEPPSLEPEVIDPDAFRAALAADPEAAARFRAEVQANPTALAEVQAAIREASQMSIVGADAFNSTTALGGNLLSGLTFGGAIPGLTLDATPTQPVIGESGGGFLGGLADVLGSVVSTVTSPQLSQLLRVLADAGVVRGTVGELYATPQLPASTGSSLPSTTTGPVGTGPGGALSVEDFVGSLIRILQDRAITAMTTAMTPDPQGEPMATEAEILAALSQAGLGGSLAGLNGRSAVGPVSCPSLWRTGMARMRIPSRVQVTHPQTGEVYVLANLGKATRGANEKSVLKSLAKANGLVCRRRGGR